MTHVKSRYTTLQRDAIMDISRRYISTFPAFTLENQEFKDRLFPPKVCFVTGKALDSRNRGDHLFEVRGYFRTTNCYGIDSKWNLIPVHSSKNYTYKKFKFIDKAGSKYTKDIGWNDLTADEIQQCDPQQQTIYQKITSWKKYCSERGVKLSFQLDDGQTQQINRAIEQALHSIDQVSVSISPQLRETETERETERERERIESSPPETPRVVTELPAYDKSQWITETKVRPSGKKDTYYYHVVTQKKLRSKRQAREYQSQLHSVE